MKKFGLLTIGLSLLLMAVPLVSARAADGYYIASGTTVNITEFSVCKKVTNNSAHEIYVPTKSNVEWQSFYNHVPTGVTLGTCVAPSPCTLDGQTIASGSSITAYQARNVASPATCASISETRTCTSPTLSGTYPYASCAPKVVTFTGGSGAFSSSDVLTAARSMNTAAGIINPTPALGGVLTLNGVALGNYDYAIKDGDQTISSFVSSDWFTNVADSHSAWITINGNLTIDSGQTFTPPVRKLFTVLYVNGNLTVNGAISMTARGSSHGGLVNAGNILIATGTYSGVVNPLVPAAGGANGTARGAGGNGVNGATGGGGAGGGAAATTSVGSAGTSFSGGSGGGGDWTNGGCAGGANAAANGGAGGKGCSIDGWYANGGGAGNNGGAGYAATGWANAGGNGTGGVLIILVEGTYSGSGSISANGVGGGSATSFGSGSAGGGGSGGGSVTILSQVDSGPTPVAIGGQLLCPFTLVPTFSCAEGSYGGAGGNGTARKLILPPPSSVVWTGPTSGYQNMITTPTLAFTTPGTYSITVTSNLTLAFNGASGGGGGNTSYANSSPLALGGAGGGGGAVQKGLGATYSFVPGTAYTLVVGAGGTSGTSAGQTSLFQGGTLLIGLSGGSVGGAGGTGGTIFGGTGGTGGPGNDYLGNCPTCNVPGTAGTGTAGGTGGGGGGGGGSYNAHPPGNGGAGGNGGGGGSNGSVGLTENPFQTGGIGGLGGGGASFTGVSGTYGGGGGGAGGTTATAGSTAGGTGQNGVGIFYAQ